MQPNKSFINKVVFYQPELHKEQLMMWAKQWGINQEVIDLLPTTGLIIEGICTAFLYETNSSLCMMEGFISNKEIDKELRDKALDEIVLALFDLAKLKGFKYMKGDTRYQTVVDRGVRLGFTLSPHSYQSLYRRLQ